MLDAGPHSVREEFTALGNKNDLLSDTVRVTERMCFRNDGFSRSGNGKPGCHVEYLFKFKDP